MLDYQNNYVECSTQTRINVVKNFEILSSLRVLCNFDDLTKLLFLDLNLILTKSPFRVYKCNFTIITILCDFPRRRGFLCQKYLSQIDSTATRNLFVSRENAKKMRFSLSDSNCESRSIQKRETWEDSGFIRIHIPIVEILRVRFVTMWRIRTRGISTTARDTRRAWKRTDFLISPRDSRIR